MANLSTYLRSTSAAPPSIHGPGSNGFLKRIVFARPGTFTWVAEKAGAIKIQAIGAAAGGFRNYAGCSGAYGEKRLNLVKGDTLTIVVGEGSLGQLNSTPANGGTTSISGGPVGGTPLTLVGALGGQVTTNASDGGPGVATGPWDTSFPGARPIGERSGSPSSGSPFGPGKSVGNQEQGGAGWSGVYPVLGDGQFDTAAGQPSVRSPSRRLALSIDPYEDFWDLAFAESTGGPAPRGYGNPLITDPGRLGGVGAGGSAGFSISNATGPGLPSVLGGGTGMNRALPPIKSGHGGGGSAWRAPNEQAGGPGGDGIVLIFWDEVA